MWQLTSQSTSSPGCVCVLTAIWFDMVPDGTNRPASLPSRSATDSSRRLTVGSSPKTSSPTSAAFIAARIPAVGRVTVSLRRSMIGSGMRIPLSLRSPPQRGARRLLLPILQEPAFADAPQEDLGAGTAFTDPTATSSLTSQLPSCANRRSSRTRIGSLRKYAAVSPTSLSNARNARASSLALGNSALYSATWVSTNFGSASWARR